MLRQFSLENKKHKKKSIIDIIVDIIHLESIEEKLVKTLGNRYPVVTIGLPGDFFQKPGAFRIYPQMLKLEWQQAANFLISNSKIALFYIDMGHDISKGLTWEINQSFYYLQKNKAVVIFTNFIDYPQFSLLTRIFIQIGYKIINPGAITIGKKSLITFTDKNNSISAYVIDEEVGLKGIIQNKIYHKIKTIIASTFPETHEK